MLFILTIGFVNLALGAIAAVVLSPDFRFSDLRDMLRFRKHSEHSATSAADHDESSHSSVDDRGMDLPVVWKNRLFDAGVGPTSHLEAALHIIRLDEADFRDRILPHENALMQVSCTDELKIQVDALIELASTWREWSSPVRDALKTYRGNVQIVEPMASKLLDLVLDQVSKWDSLEVLLAAPFAEHEIQTTAKRLRQEVLAIIDKSLLLHDGSLDALGVLHRSESRVDEIKPNWQKDRTTGLLNRLGLETEFEAWVTANTINEGLVSAALVQLDRLDKLNDRLGVEKANAIYRSFAKVVAGAIRSERGDRTVRLRGSTLLLLLTDTGVTGARTVAERVRQIIEAVTFQLGSDEITCAANCAVCEVMLDDKLNDMIDRLSIGLQFAKDGGRNRTAIDEGQGPVIFDPVPVHVKAMTVFVDGAN